MELLLIKIGGSVITDKKTPYKTNIPIIRKIAKVLKGVKTPLLLSHGSGSFGHTSAQKYGGKHGYSTPWGIAKVSYDAMDINRIFMSIFIEEGLPVVSFRPQSFLLAKNGTLEEAFVTPIAEALKQGMIPVVYGDVIWDTRWKSTIFSGETILNILCRYLQKDYTILKIIELCDVDGVFDLDKKVIPVITPKNWHEIKTYISKNDTADVTGGMRHKIESALNMTEQEIETWIINGNSPKELSSLIKGQSAKGTIIR